MKRFSRISIFVLSICFSYTSVYARQAIDDHADLVRSMNDPVQLMHHDIAQISLRLAYQRYWVNSVANFTRNNQNIDSDETKHVKKLLWLHIQAHGSPDDFDKKIKKNQLYRANKKAE